MAGPKVDQYSEIGLARLCDRCSVLEDLEFLRRQADKEERLTLSGDLSYLMKNFNIVSWPNLKKDQIALPRCEFCRLMLAEVSSGTSNSRWQFCPTKFHVDVQGIAISGENSFCPEHRNKASWVVYGFRIRFTSPEDGIEFHLFDLIIGSDEG